MSHDVSQQPASVSHVSEEAPSAGLQCHLPLGGDTGDRDNTQNSSSICKSDIYEKVLIILRYEISEKNKFFSVESFFLYPIKLLVDLLWVLAWWNEFSSFSSPPLSTVQLWLVHRELTSELCDKQ